MPANIEPTALYITSTLSTNSNESTELFFKLKKNTENLYSGKIHTDRLVKYNFISDITDYLRSRKFLQTFHPSESYSPSKYQFVKCCWLADSILTQGMHNPLSVHYNPRIKKNVVHPGQTRSYISQLFQPGPVDCLYFNTAGIRFPWMKSFDIVSQDRLQDIAFSHLSIIADHGSLIPQIFFGDYKNAMTEVIKYQKFIGDRLSNMQFRIKSNIPITPLEYWATTDDNAPIEIYIKDTRISNDVARACILAVLGKPYKSDTLEVKINTV